MTSAVSIPFDYTLDFKIRVFGREMAPDSSGIFCNKLTKTYIQNPANPNIKVYLQRKIGFAWTNWDSYTYTSGVETHCFRQVPDGNDDYRFQYDKASDGQTIRASGRVF